MKQIFTMVLFGLLLTSLYGKSAKWQNLKPLEAYSTSDYTLKDGVEYLEVRQYIWSRKVDKNNYNVMISAYRKDLNSFDKKFVKKFKSAAPNFTKEGNIRKVSYCMMSGCTSSQSNGFMIDNKGKMWRMNEVSDIVNCLGTIDTPAELKLVLWLNKEDVDNNAKYRKISTEYIVISEYDNSIDNYGECGHFVYRLNISKKGVITKKKLLKKTASKNGCMTMD